MQPTIKELLSQYVTAVKKIYGSHLKSIILYGSYARGDFDKNSDVDIMVLVDLPETELNNYSDLISELGFEYNVTYDIWFMPIVKNIEHFKYWCKEYSFYANIVKEGVALYEAA